MTVSSTRAVSPIRQFSERVFWIAILLLSPLTYLGSLYLARLLPAPSGPILISRESAVQIASDYARNHDVDLKGWTHAVIVSDSANIPGVVARVRSEAIDQVASPAAVTAIFHSPNKDRTFRVTMTPVGRVIGFRMSEPPTASDVTDEAAQAAATAFLRAMIPGPFPLGAPVMTAGKAKQGRIFDWKMPVPGLPEVHAQFQVQTAGSLVIAEFCNITADSAFTLRLQPFHPLMVSLGVLCAFSITALSIYAIVRYIRRRKEKEVSHRRTILAALAFALTGIVSIYQSISDVTGGVPGQGPPLALLLGVMFFVILIVGAFIGVAYGAGEGDVRAVYPGKLTSLDALLSGKIFSANVARSILAGGAFAGAVLLLQNLALLVTGAMPPLNQHDAVRGIVQAFPFAALLSDTGDNAILIAAFGLLLPISLLRSRVRKEWLFYVLLSLCLLVVTLAAADTSSWRLCLITLTVFASAAAIPFFYGDLLAAISSIIALDLVGTLLYRSLVSEGWTRVAADVTYTGIAFLLVEVWCAWRGRIYEDREVRPRYASFLAEHQALQAEIGAAREAQLRLLPATPPTIAGLSIAGACIPSREVAGDFFDYYALDDHRLGVFVAEGGTGELGPAMTIALAKGFLLYTARLDLTPVAVLRRLRDFLSETLDHHDASVSMVYAVIDARTGTVRFARAGNSPRLSLNGAEAVEELAAAQDGGATLSHGVFNLAQGDALVFYTDGLAARILDSKGQPAGAFLARTIAKAPAGGAHDLHAAILKAAVRHRNQRPPDDVTAVVVRLQEGNTCAMEVVA